MSHEKKALVAWKGSSVMLVSLTLLVSISFAKWIFTVPLPLSSSAHFLSGLFNFKGLGFLLLGCGIGRYDIRVLMRQVLRLKPFANRFFESSLNQRGLSSLALIGFCWLLCTSDPKFGLRILALDVIFLYGLVEWIDFFSARLNVTSQRLLYTLFAAIGTLGPGTFLSQLHADRPLWLWLDLSIWLGMSSLIVLKKDLIVWLQAKPSVLQCLVGGYTWVSFKWAIWSLKPYLYAVQTDFLSFEKTMGLMVALVGAGDVCAYLAGRQFGKRLFVPKLSPQKTWIGLWGGLAGVYCISVLLNCIFVLPPLPNTLLQYFAPLGIYLMAVLGDLHESLWKRVFNIKDSGNLIPGHGGVLDRLDSYTLVLPVLLFIFPFAVMDESSSKTIIKSFCL